MHQSHRFADDNIEKRKHRGGTMQILVNEALLPFINEGRISMQRLMSLIYIKDFIDRISTRPYIDEETVRSLERRYGVRPSVASWGDYFQTEMAVSLLECSDDEFARAVETLRFDMAASWMIFCEKESSFFEWVENEYEAVISNGDGDYTNEEKEILHLKILMDYYLNLGLANNFTKAEMAWFEGFSQAEAI